MNSENLIYPGHVDTPYIIVHRNLIKMLGDNTRANIAASILGFHDHFVRKMGDRFPGKFYQSHEQIKKAFEGTNLSSNIISDIIQKGQDLGLWIVTKEKGNGTIVKNWFKVDVRKVKRILSDSTLRDDTNSTIRDDKEKYNTKRSKKETSKDVLAASTRTAKYIKGKDGKYRKILFNRNNPVPNKEVNPVQEIVKPIPKIKKKSDLQEMSCNAFKKAPPAPKYKYTVADFQLYNELIQCGATNHQKDTYAYYRSMDFIHMLMHPSKCIPPFAYCKQVPDDYKKKHWTHEEIVSVFKFYMKDSDRPTRSISGFIYTEPFKDTKGFSILSIFYKKMSVTNYDSLNDAAKKMHKWLEEDRMIGELTPADLKSMIANQDAYTKGYRLSEQVHTTYFGDPTYVLFQYIKEKMKNMQFQIYYVRGSKFYEEFSREMIKRGVLVKDN